MKNWCTQQRWPPHELTLFFLFSLVHSPCGPFASLAATSSLSILLRILPPLLPFCSFLLSISISIVLPLQFTLSHSLIRTTSINLIVRIHLNTANILSSIGYIYSYIPTRKLHCILLWAFIRNFTIHSNAQCSRQEVVNRI